LRLYFYDGLYVPIVVSNPLSGRKYPEEGEVLALIDTGFNGFLIVPEDVFGAVGAVVVDEANIVGACCEVRAKVSPIRIIIGGLNLSIDGECLTYEGAREVVLGMEVLSKLRITFDGCRKEGHVGRCGMGDRRP